MTKEDYAKKAWQWAKALKLLDPTITLILCGETGYSSWDYYVLNQCVKWSVHGLSGDTTKSFIDMHSIHVWFFCFFARGMKLISKDRSTQQTMSTCPMLPRRELLSEQSK
jgi:hypothetical protein